MKAFTQSRLMTQDIPAVISQSPRLMTQNILVVISQSHYITSWAFMGLTHTDPDADTALTIMTQSTEVSGSELHKTYSYLDLNITPNGGATPSPRPRGNLTQRVSQRSQRFLRLGHLTPTATLHKDTARLICTIMIVL